MAAILAPLVATGLGISLNTATLVTSVALLAGATAAQYYLQQANQTRPESGTKLSAASGGDVPLSMIFGEKETAGSLIYAGTWGRFGKTPNAFYTRVYCLSDYPCTSMLSRCWHDGNKGTIDLAATSYTASDGATSGTAIGHPITSLDYNGKHWAWVKFLDGSQTVADPFLMEVFGGLASRPWTSDMIGRGRALMIVTQRYNRKQPIAEISLVPVLNGAKLYDWRKDSTNGGTGAHRWDTPSTHEYSSDPITIAYNIKRGIRYGATVLYGGQNWAARRFDNDSWTAAANVCDQNVTLAAGGTQKRYRVGGEISFDEQPLDVIDRLLASCAGRMLESGGIYKVSAGGIGASVYSFTDDDIVISEAMTGQMFPSREEICNTISGTYVEPEDGGQMTAYKKRTRADYLTADNDEVRSKAMDFDYVRDNVRAQQLAQLALNDNRRFLTKVVTFPSIARKLEPYDVLNWSASDRFGFVNKKFICGDGTLNDNGTVSIPIREADATDADWVTGNEDAYTVGIYGDIVPESQTIVISVSAYGIRNNANANRQPGLKIAWTDDVDDIDCKYVRYQVRLLDTSYMVAQGRVDWDETKAIISQGIERNEAYQVRAMIVPYSDRETSWCAWQTVTANEYGFLGIGDCDPTVPPNMSGAPTLTVRTRVAGDGTVIQVMKIEFDEHADTRIDYQIRVSDGTDVDNINVRSSPKVIRVQNDLTYTVRVRAVSIFGIFGVLSTASTVSVSRKSAADGAISDAAGLTVVGRHACNVLSWNRNTDTDFRHMEVWYATTAGVNFGDAGCTLLTVQTGNRWIHHNLGNGVTRWYWIRPRDRSDNIGAREPIGALPGVSGTTLRLVADDVGDGEIGGPQIGTNAVSRPKIANLAINGDKLDSLAVATGHLENLAVSTGKLDNNASTTAKIKAGAVAGGGSASGSKDIGNKTTRYTLRNFELFRRKITYINRSGAPELISVSGTLYANMGMLADENGHDGSAVITVTYYIRRGSGRITKLASYSLSVPKKKAYAGSRSFRELLLAPKGPLGATTTVWAQVSISGRQTMSSSGSPAQWTAKCTNVAATVSFMKA